MCVELNHVTSNRFYNLRLIYIYLIFAQIQILLRTYTNNLLMALYYEYHDLHASNHA